MPTTMTASNTCRPWCGPPPSVAVYGRSNSRNRAAVATTHAARRDAPGPMRPSCAMNSRDRRDAPPTPRGAPLPRETNKRPPAEPPATWTTATRHPAPRAVPVVATTNAAPPSAMSAPVQIAATPAVVRQRVVMRAVRPADAAAMPPVRPALPATSAAADEAVGPAAL